MQLVTTNWKFIERKDNSVFFKHDDDSGVITDLHCVLRTSDVRIMSMMWYETITIYGCRDDSMDTLHVIDAEFEHLKRQFSNTRPTNRLNEWFKIGKFPVSYMDTWDLLSDDQKKSVLEGYPRYIIECRLNPHVSGENYKFASRIAQTRDVAGVNPS